MDAEQGLMMGGEFDQFGQFEQMQQMQQMQHMEQFDLMAQLGQMSQPEIDQMNAVLSQCQLLDNGQLVFNDAGANDGDSGGNGSGELLATGDQQHYQLGQQPQGQQQKQQHQEDVQKQVQKQQYLQRLYLQQLQVQNEQQKLFDEAARRRAQAQEHLLSSPSRTHLQQPFPHEIPPFLNTAPAFAGAAFQQQQQQQQQLPGGGPTTATPPLYYDLQHQQQHAPDHPPQQRTSPVTWPNPQNPPLQGGAVASAAPVPIRHVTAGQQQQQQQGRGRRPSRGRSHARLASASARREHHERLERHEQQEQHQEQRQLPTAAPVHVPVEAANSPAPSPDDDLLRLQDLSIMHHHSEDAGPASAASLASSVSTATITGPSPAPSTLSPKKQRTASSSPKKTGRFESIYATLRNKASSMRRSRTAFMHESPAPTVAPMATLHNTTLPMENQHSKSHHAHHRSHHPGDLDLDLDLSAAKGAAMGSFPPTPPLTGTASSLSSTSSTFSMSACSSTASSVGDGPQFHHLVAAQYPHNSLHNHLNHTNASQEDLPPADITAFVSGLVDDPFADNSSFFGGGVGAPGLHQHQLALRPHIKTEYPPQPSTGSSGVSSACWPVTVATPNGKTSPLQPGEDNDITPVTAAINIPCRVGVPAAVSPTAYLANATANMSGSSVIASANATAVLATVAANMKRDALGNAMDTDEDWWQESVIESAVGEPLEQSPSKIGVVDPMCGAGAIPSGFPPEFIAANAQGLDSNGNLVYYMPDIATQGLMINMPSGTSTPGGQNQYYFPGITTASAGTGYPPAPPLPSGEHEYRYDRANVSSRRPKPRAPSAGARYHSTNRGDGLHSPRKRSSATNLTKTNSSSGSGLYTCDDASGISAAAMTAPSTPRSHGQLGRRSHSLQALPRTSPTPGISGSMSALPSGATTPTGAIRKRRSASNMRRVSSTQGITSLTAAAAITAAVGGAGVPEPKTPSRRRSTSVEPRPRSAKSNAGGGGGGIGFVNFTAEDHDTLMNGVAPSGSSKTKARRERELQERTRQYGERLVRAVHEAGGDVRKLEVEGLSDLAIAL
ncbi:hypothetical protein SEUCBS140593_000765 [Sporothrix eucalyptigena]|uniref:Developmental regulatory protein wetA n=1 Tax=Sporothrix eucalyptigena TaxID=1812306 RepID=A0ABP0ASJ4_9PEZI